MKCIVAFLLKGWLCEQSQCYVTRTLPVLLILCTDEELAEGLLLCDCSRHSGGSDCVAPVGV